MPPKPKNIVDLSARRDSTGDPLADFIANHKPGDPIPSLRDIDPARWEKAFMEGWMSATSLDEFEMIGRLHAKWGINITSEQARVWRHRGQGPKFHKAGRKIWYLARDVDLWAEAQKSAPPVPPSPK